MKAIDPTTGAPVDYSPPSADPPAPASAPRIPPHVNGAPPPQPSQAVDDEYLVAAAAKVLPDRVAMNEFRSWRIRNPKELSGWVENAIAAANIDPVWADEIKRIAQEIATEADKLNLVEGPPNPPPAVAVEPLPGIDPASPCRSLMDPSLLGFTPRKAVFSKSFHRIGIIDDLGLVDPPAEDSGEPAWRIGLKLENIQEWRHFGFTPGSLVSTVSLGPGETQQLEIDSWLRTKIESEAASATTSENSSEYERRRTDEQATLDQATESSGWNVSASGSLEDLGIPLTLGGGYNDSSTHTTQSTQRRIDESTSKATHKLSETRSTKILQSTEVGSESKTLRTVVNPNAGHALTLKFFDVVRLMDVRLRFVNDAPMLLIAGVFPAVMSGGKTTVIPFGVLEALNSPPNFLIHYFEIDHDISQSIWGIALRARSNPFEEANDPAISLKQLAEALFIAAKYLYHVPDPAAVTDKVAAIVAAYARHTIESRKVALLRYKFQRIEQITTGGIYVDSTLSTCSALEEYAESQRYTAAFQAHADLELTRAEVDRRRARLAQVPALLDPFAPEPNE